MKFSVCILTYQRDDDIRNLLSDLFLQAVSISKEVEFIVVDNNSNDHLRTSLPSPGPACFRYVFSDANLGVAGGRNKAASIARGEYLIFFDDDVIIPDFKKITHVVSEIFDSEPHVSAVAMRIIDHHRNEICGSEIPHPDKKIDMASTFYTSHCIGAGHAIRKEAFVQVGGFDETGGIYGMEEVSISYRLVGKGGQIKYSPLCEVRHLRSPDGRLPPKAIIWRNFTNKLRISIDHLPVLYVWTHVLVWSFYYSLRSWDFIGVVRAIREANRSNRRKQLRFGPAAMGYMKKVRARLWY
jgi:GT2 family glycosyltransferase